MSFYKHPSVSDMSQMMVNGCLVTKSDLIARISINSQHYFTVYRRYNSSYDILVEDYRGEVYAHKDYTVRQSMKNVLCITDSEADHILTDTVFSYKHGVQAPSSHRDIADMRWSEIQSLYQGIDVNFVGILTGFSSVSTSNPFTTSVVNTFPWNNIVTSVVPTTPHTQNILQQWTPPSAPVKSEKPNYTKNDLEAVRNLLNLSVPPVQEPIVVSDSDVPEQSMRHNDLAGHKRSRPDWSCYCEYCDDEDMDADNEYDEEDNVNNYTVLRNGTLVPKRH